MKKCWCLILGLIAFSVLLLVMTACGGGGGGGSDGPAATAEPDPVPAITAETGTLVEEALFTQPIVSLEKMVDILIVMDSSGSLEDERAKLAEALPEILNELDGLDSYTLGMILAWGSAIATADYEGAGHLYKVGSNPYVFDSTLHSKVDIIAWATDTIATPPPKDNTGEAGLYSLDQLMTVHSAEAKSRGFFREGAAFVVIFMSDENDICADYPEGVTPVPDPEGLEAEAFERYCKDTDGNRTITAESVYLTVSDFMASAPAEFTGLVYTGPTVPDVNENEIGYGYLDVIEIADGVAIDLFAPDFLELARNLGNSINALAADLKVRFTLSFESVNPLSIQVLVDGQSEEYVYDEENEEVILNYAGVPGSIIDITYRVLE